MLGVTIGCIAIAAVTIGPAMSDIEIPNYEVLETDGKMELRRYPPMIIAEVTVEGARDVAVGDGFRLLADYIFGNNKMAGEIAMTAPVQQEKGAKIAMTLPVEQQAAGESWVDGVWKVSFIMPSEYKMDTLPNPNDNRVTLTEVPAKQFIAMRFSGTSSNENIKTHEEKLLAYIKENNLSITGQAKYAFYNPPWTLPFMRRNEVMFEVIN